MIDKKKRQQIIALMKREVVPAIGCTEPMAVSLCVAKATETLGCIPAKIEALLSANILKNAMGVGIPGTHMVGLPIAVALGALVGKSSYGLEVLRDTTIADLEGSVSVRPPPHHGSHRLPHPRPRQLLHILNNPITPIGYMRSLNLRRRCYIPVVVWL